MQNTNRDDAPDDFVQLVPIDDSTDEARQARLAQSYRERRDVESRSISTPGRPQREAADLTTWWGGRRESPAIQRHNRQIQDIYLTGVRSQYTVDWTMLLEYHGFKEAIKTIAAEESALLQMNPNTLAAAIGDQLILDSAERIRRGITDIQEHFRRRALGTT